VELGKYTPKFRRTIKSTYHPTWRHIQYENSHKCYTFISDIQSYTSLNSVSDIRNNLSISSPVRNFRNRVCCLDFLRNITAISEYIEGEIKQQNGETWTTELRNLCTYILLQSPNRKRLVGNSDRTRILGGPTHIWEHIIKMELDIQGCRLDSSELCSTR